MSVLRMKATQILFCCCVIALFHAVRLSAQGPEPKKILDDMLQTMGGQSYMDVNDIHTTGRFFQFSKRGELTGGDYFSDYIKFPMMERTELGVARRKEITINNGDAGWKITPKDKAPLEQTPAEVKDFKASFKTSLDYVLRFTLAEKQTTIQNVGVEMLDFNRADLIEIRDPAKNRIVLYVDRSTKLPVKMEMHRSDEKLVREDRYSNWHTFQGIMTPLNIEHYTDGLKTMEIHNEMAVYNSDLSNSLFSPPAKK